MTDRIFELWVGSQGSGKTFTIERRVQRILEACRISSLWWLDTTAEREVSKLRMVGPVIRAIGDYLAYLDSEGGALPDEICVDLWSEKTEVKAVQVLREAQREGDALIVADEAYHELPHSGLTPEWRRVVLAGRHLPADDGSMRPMHLVLATQHPRTVSHLAVGQAKTVMIAARIQGERTRDWVRQEAGPAALARIDELPEHSWLCVRGTPPDCGPQIKIFK